jgi:hypothetical protein
MSLGKGMFKVFTAPSSVGGSFTPIDRGTREESLEQRLQAHGPGVSGRRGKEAESQSPGVGKRRRKNQRQRVFFIDCGTQ